MTPHQSTPPSRRSIVLPALLLGVAIGSLLVLPNSIAGTSVDETAPSGHKDRVSTIIALVERYATDRADLERFHSIPVSPGRMERLSAHVSEWIDRVDAIDVDHLDVEDRIDHRLLRNDLERARGRLERERLRHAELAHLLPFAEAIVALEEARWRVEPVDARLAATRLGEILAQVHTLHKSIAAGESRQIDPVMARRAAEAVDALRGALARWHDHHDEFRPEFRWWVRVPHSELAASLTEYSRLLREEIAGLRGKPDDPLIGDPLGRTRLVEELAHELISESPEALLAIADAEFAWCEARLAESAEALDRELAHALREPSGDATGTLDWRRALEHVKESHVAPGEQDLLVAEQARAAIDFVVERDLVMVPELARETWRIEMLSEQRQRTLPFAAYGGQHMLVAYPTETMEHGRKIESMRGNNVHFSRIVTAHELVPGHHLQGFFAARHNVHRRHFRTAFLVEGWALHWEMLLWDLGYATGPADEIGMLFWRMLRCARIVVSLRFHLGADDPAHMSPPQMIDFLVQRVGLEPDGATAEVRRYVSDAYGPLYQAAYMLGGLQLRALHKELVTDGTMGAREFHDAVLRCNSIPIELIGASLRGKLPAQ